MTATVPFENPTLGHDRHPAVHPLQAEIADASLTAFAGPDGGGKSTLPKGVIGSLAPLEGRVRFSTLGREDVAHVSQQLDIDRSFPLSVAGFVAMGLWRVIGPFGDLGCDHGARVADAVTAVGLAGFEGRPIGSLSRGTEPGGPEVIAIVMAPGLQNMNC